MTEQAQISTGSKSAVNVVVIPFDKFLCHDRKELNQPFSDGKNTFYSDGYVILRLPCDGKILKEPPFEIKLPWPNGLLPHLISVKAPIIKKEKCKYCNGYGEIVACGDCDGTGYVEWYIGKHTYEADCVECEGTGFIHSGDGDKCDNCEGTGSVDAIEVQHVNGNVGLSNVVLKKLSLLPNCKISCGVVGENIFYFSFDGGDGLAMGMLV